MFEKEKEKLIAEIKNKSSRLDSISVNAAGGYHVLDEHVGCTEEQLINRLKDEHKYVVSSFYSENELNRALQEICNNTVLLKEIVRWLFDEKAEKKDFENETEDNCGICVRFERETRSYITEETYIYRFSLQRRSDMYDRNPVTGMPFDVKTIFPVMDYTE